MQAIPIRIYIILFVLVLIYPPSLIAAPEQRTALVIGNGAYSSSPLKNPVNDANDMAATLKRLGFDVILKKNVTHRPMEEAIRDFGSRLKRQKGVGLFFYAGHGLQVNGANYLLPIGAKVDKETDVQFEAVNVERILAEMANADNGLNIVMLDACRDNPFRSLFRSSSRGLAMISNAPTGTFISYSTAPNQVARDGSGRNSPYTSALLKHIQEPGLTIEDVFKGVRQKVRKETGQVPWELSSLEGKFYFNSGKASRIAEQVKDTPVNEQVSDRPSVDLDDEQQKVEKKLAMGKRTSVSTASNIIGKWTAACKYKGVEYPHDIIIVDQKEDGSIVGRGGYPAGGNSYIHAWVITSGLVTENNVDFVMYYTTGGLQGTTAHIVGRIDQDGSMVGTWTDNYNGTNRRATFKAKR